MSKKLSWLDRAKAAFHSKDEEGFNAAMEEAKTKDEGSPEGEQHIHVHMNSQGAVSEPAAGTQTDEENMPVKFTDADLEEHIAQNAAEHEAFSSRLAAIEKHLGIGETTSDDDEEIEEQLESEAPVGTGDKARKSNDSVFMADSFKDTVALAEILAPGIRIPTFDRAANPKKTFKDVCGVRRQALDLAYAQPVTRSMIDDVMGGKPVDFKVMSCDAVRTVFKAVGSMKRASNNDASRGKGSIDEQTKPAKKMTLRDMNKAADAKWLK